MSAFPIFTPVEISETKNFKVLLASVERDKKDSATDVRVTLKNDGELTDYYINATGITQFTRDYGEMWLDKGIILSWNLPTFITFEPEKFPIMVALKKKITRTDNHEIQGLQSYPHIQTISGVANACIVLKEAYATRDRYNRIVSFQRIAADGQTLELPDYMIGNDVRIETLEHILNVLRRSKTEMNGAGKKDIARRIGNIGPYLAVPKVEYWTQEDLKELKAYAEKHEMWDEFIPLDTAIQWAGPSRYDIG